jgi:methionine-rich copper-binding protein CopC
MRYLQSVLAVLVAMVVIGCGAGHPNLTSITVTPQSATTTSNPQGQVGYTAMGNFSNHTSRELSQVDGLSWKTSPTMTGTTAATIGSTGEATCSAPGTVTVTASAPQNLQLTVNNGVMNTSATATGTATLICQ